MASESKKDITTEAALQAVEDALALEAAPEGDTAPSGKDLDLFDPDFAELELKLAEAANDLRRQDDAADAQLREAGPVGELAQPEELFAAAPSIGRAAEVPRTRGARAAGTPARSRPSRSIPACCRQMTTSGSPLPNWCMRCKGSLPAACTGPQDCFRLPGWRFAAGYTGTARAAAC
jgi:hypothetical protein